MSESSQSTVSLSNSKKSKKRPLAPNESEDKDHTKAQRTNNHSVSHSIDLSRLSVSDTAPPIHQTICQLDKLIPPLFQEVYSYLTFDERCDSFPRLNRSINRLFDQAICTDAPLWIGVRPNDDTEQIKRHSTKKSTKQPRAPKKKIAKQATGRAKFIKRASHLSLILNHIDNPKWLEKVQSDVKSLVYESITGSSASNHRNVDPPAVWQNLPVIDQPIFPVTIDLSSTMQSNKQSINQSNAISSSLQSLDIVDIVKSSEKSISQWPGCFSELLFQRKLQPINQSINQSINQPINQTIFPYSLTELSITVIDQGIMPDNWNNVTYTPVPAYGEWTGLSALSSLKYVTIAFPRSSIIRNDDQWYSYCQMIGNLSPSVEQLRLEAGSDMGYLEESIYASFEDDKMLPNLQRLILFVGGVVKPLGLYDLETTIMQSTGAIRPFISGVRMMPWKFMKSLKLVDLFYEHDRHDDDLCAQLRARPVDLWPNLERVHIKCGNLEPVTDLIEFAAHRPVTQFYLISSPTAQLNHVVVHALCRMSQLRHLDLRARKSVLFANPTDVQSIRANCWPLLERLDLESENEDEATLAALLAAAPGCRDVSVTNRNSDGTSTKLSPSKIIAMTIHYCPRVIRLTVSSTSHQNDTLIQTRAAFERYPLHSTVSPSQSINQSDNQSNNQSNNGLQHLQALSLWGCLFDSVALHYLLQQLSHAPHLSYVDASVAARSLLDLCMFRSLPHLQVLKQVHVVLEQGEWTLQDLSSDLDPFIQHVPIHMFPSRLDKLTFHAHFNHPLLTSTNVQESTAWKDGANGFYRSFNRNVPTSRQQFFDTIYNKLSAVRKRSIKA